MPRAKAEQLLEGMVVARDVKNIDGMLLVAADTRLSLRQIGILQAWGVTEVEIECGSEVEAECDPLAKLPPEVRERMTAELRRRFWRAEDFGEVQKQVFQLMLLRQARRTTGHMK